MTEPLTGLCKGERVMVSLEGRTVEAEVVVVSKSGVSLGLEFEAILGGYAGMMPVRWQDGEYQDLIKGRRVEISRKQ